MLAFSRVQHSRKPPSRQPCKDPMPLQPPPTPDSRWAFFLDFDGTLVEIAERPDAVVVGAQLRTLLAGLAEACGGALAIVSGRSIADLDRFLAPLVLPAVGLHGIELRAGAGEGVRAGELDSRLLEEAKAAAVALQGKYRDLDIEDKGRSLALHYRRAPDAEKEARRMLQRVVASAGTELTLLDGKMVLEVKPAGVSKGDGLRAMLDAEPFAGRRPCFLGDDVTDEAAFEACNEKEGVTVHIGDGTTVTAAHYRLPDPNAVQAWLGQAVEKPQSAAP